MHIVIATEGADKSAPRVLLQATGDLLEVGLLLLPYKGHVVGTDVLLAVLDQLEGQPLHHFLADLDVHLIPLLLGKLSAGLLRFLQLCLHYPLNDIDLVVEQVLVHLMC